MAEVLEAATTDLTFLLAPAPKGLGLDLEDGSLTDTIERNPESLTKEIVADLTKHPLIAVVAGKVFAVRSASLPNVIRAIGRLLQFCDPHTSKLCEEFRCSALVCWKSYLHA